MWSSHGSKVMTGNTFHSDPLGCICGDGEHKEVDLR